MQNCLSAASNLIHADACASALSSAYLAAAHAGLAYILAIAGLAVACRVLARHF